MKGLDSWARFLRMREEGLPRDDLLLFNSTMWYLIHELRLAEVWGINSALRQKLLSIGLDQAETHEHYSELRTQPEIKVAFERIRSEYLLEMGYIPYPQL